MTDSTILRLAGMGVPPYSARGLTETLQPIQEQGQLLRNINGETLDMSDTAFRKYAVTVSGKDQQAPALDMVWIGTLLTVDCITELVFETSTSGPSRTAVPGSSREANGFTFYRPRLDVVVTAFSIQTDEYGAAIGWSLGLEEA